MSKNMLIQETFTKSTSDVFNLLFLGRGIVTYF